MMVGTKASTYHYRLRLDTVIIMFGVVAGRVIIGHPPPLAPRTVQTRFRSPVLWALDHSLLSF